MRKLFFIVVLLFIFTGREYGQVKPGVRLSEKDSVELLNELMTLLDSAGSPVSYGVLNIGIGNRLFSIKNYALNARQSNTSVVIYSPSLAYFHKSGFGLTAGAGLLTEAGRLGVNQYLLSPSFDLASNKNVAFGISYTRYFVSNKYSPFSSPIQNDFFTSATYKKTWVRPGIGFGYATGEYKEARYKDTVVAGVRRHLYDSVTYRLTAFSMMLTAGHQFSWYNVFTASDGLVLTSTLMANAGSSKTKITHRTNAVALFNFFNKRGRIPKFQRSKFEMQSVGLNLDLAYTVGNFNFQPQLYTDYYLPAGDPGMSKIAVVFTFNFGYTF